MTHRVRRTAERLLRQRCPLMECRRRTPPTTTHLSTGLEWCRSRLLCYLADDEQTSSIFSFRLEPRGLSTTTFHILWREWRDLRVFTIHDGIVVSSGDSEAHALDDL